jgi:hypothetical protein
VKSFYFTSFSRKWLQAAPEVDGEALPNEAKDCFANITILCSPCSTILTCLWKKKNFANIKDKVSSLAHKDLQEREREI